jgi:hypothetical protein
MARRERHKPEQVVNLRRQVEVAAANRKTTSLAYKAAEIMRPGHCWIPLREGFRSHECTPVVT